MSEIEELVERAMAGERRALGRLLTVVERGGDGADEVTELTYSTPQKAHVIGITGAPGSGKSTLVGHLIAQIADAQGQPAVLAVDPSSPLTGGAILGDRIRMDPVADGLAFIRSMATRGHQGGLALAVPGALRLFNACGYGPIVVETVGVGQVEVDVARATDTTVVVTAPGMGDAVQANKSGLLEVADVLVVNKADRPGANDARRDLELMLDLGHVSGLEGELRPEILMTTATEGEGIAELWQSVVSHRDFLHSSGQLSERRRRRLRHEVKERVGQRADLAIDARLNEEPDELLAALDGRLSPPRLLQASPTSCSGVPHTIGSPRLDRPLELLISSPASA